MPEAPQQTLDDLRVDRDNLYREHTLTDLKVASIRELVPVTPEGDPDTTRASVFIGQTQLMTQMGPLPVQAQIDATDLDGAIAAFPAAMQRAVHEMVEEAKELRRQEAGRIVLPGQDFPADINLGEK